MVHTCIVNGCELPGFIQLKMDLDYVLMQDCE